MRRIAQAWRCGRRDVPWFAEMQRLEDEQVLNSSPMRGLRAGSRPLNIRTSQRCPLEPNTPPGCRPKRLRESLLGRDLGPYVSGLRGDEIARRNIERGFHIGLGRVWRQPDLFEFM